MTTRALLKLSSPSPFFLPEDRLIQGVVKIALDKEEFFQNYRSMISWMQDVLEKHLKWLFMGLLVVIIVSFVFTIGPSMGIGEPHRKVHKELFCGFDLSNPVVVDHLQKGVFLWFMLGNQQPLTQSQGLEGQILPRAVLLNWSDLYNVPVPTEQALASYIKKQSLFQDAHGQFDPKAYETFLNWTKTGGMLSADSMAELLSENWRIQVVLDALRGPGYALAEEAVQQLRSLETTWLIRLASLGFDAFNPTITVSAQELEAYYKAHPLAYTAPEQVHLSCVRYSTKSFMDKVPPADEVALRAYFEAHKKDFIPKGETGVDFASVRAPVVQAWTAEQAQRLGSEAASAFIYRLYEQKIPAHSQALQEALAAENLKLRPLPSYGMDTIPSSTPFSQRDLTSAFALDETAYYSDPLPIKSGVGIIFYEGRTPSAVAPFEQVKDRVEEDYKAEQKRRLFSEWGQKTRSQLIALMASGSSFEEAADKLGLQVSSPAPFTLETYPSALSEQLIDSIVRLSVGGVSPMQTIEDRGLFIYLQDKQMPSISPSDARVAERLQSIEAMTAQLTAVELIDHTVEQGMKSLDVPD